MHDRHSSAGDDRITGWVLVAAGSNVKACWHVERAAVNETDKDALRAAIEAEHGRVAGQIANLERSFAGIVDAAELTSNDDEHDPEGTTIAYERAQVAALLAQAREDLVALDAAIDRVDDGTAETCVSCGGPIPLERLLALPGVVTCVQCAS
jgi:DnaK suppressor protein